MYKLFLLTFLFSTYAFANKCTSGNCLFGQGFGAYELIENQQPDQLNHYLSIFDLMGPDVNYYRCFSGSLTHLQKVISELIRYTNNSKQFRGEGTIISHHGYTSSDGYQLVLEINQPNERGVFIFDPMIYYC